MNYLKYWCGLVLLFITFLAQAQSPSADPKPTPMPLPSGEFSDDEGDELLGSPAVPQPTPSLRINPPESTVTVGPVQPLTHLCRRTQAFGHALTSQMLVRGRQLCRSVYHASHSLFGGVLSLRDVLAQSYANMHRFRPNGMEDFVYLSDLDATYMENACVKNACVKNACVKNACFPGQLNKCAIEYVLLLFWEAGGRQVFRNTGHDLLTCYLQLSQGNNRFSESLIRYLQYQGLTDYGHEPITLANDNILDLSHTSFALIYNESNNFFILINNSVEPPLLFDLHSSNVNSYKGDELLEVLPHNFEGSIFYILNDDDSSVDSDEDS